MNTVDIITSAIGALKGTDATITIHGDQLEIKLNANKYCKEKDCSCNKINNNSISVIEQPSQVSDKKKSMGINLPDMKDFCLGEPTIGYLINREFNLYGSKIFSALNKETSGRKEISILIESATHSFSKYNLYARLRDYKLLYISFSDINIGGLVFLAFSLGKRTIIIKVFNNRINLFAYEEGYYPYLCLLLYNDSSNSNAAVSFKDVAHMLYKPSGSCEELMLLDVITEQTDILKKVLSLPLDTEGKQMMDLIRTETKNT